MRSLGVKLILTFLGTGIVGLVAGSFISGLLVYHSLEAARQETRAGWNLAPVVAVAKDAPAGTVLEFDMLEQRSFPEQFVTESIILPHSAIYVVGQKLSSPLQQGDPIRWGDFESTRFTSISAEVRKMGRAMRIPVEGICDMSTWIRPMDHVDLVYVGPDPEQRDEKIAMVLIQHAQVLAVGRIAPGTNLYRHPKGHRDCEALVVHLLPEDAMQASIAMSMGELVPVLRNREDMDYRETRSRTTLADLHDESKLALSERVRRETIQIPPRASR